MNHRLAYLFLGLLLSQTALGQVTLPFFEGFENIGSTTTFTSSTSSINGLSEWEYDKTARGRVRFKAGNGFYRSGSAAATFDASTNNTASTNYLILTLDLSNYENSNLELSFAYMDHGDESNNEDRIWVRGDDSKSWVEIYNWYSNRATAGNWKLVSGLDIDATLAGAGQKVSKTFQLRIGQRDNWPATNTGGFDGMTIDNIEIIERFHRDAYPTEFSNFCAGTGTLKATIVNDGLDTIKTATIDWSVNSVNQKSAKYTGQILPGRSVEITLGTTTFSSSNTIWAVVDSINGDEDEMRDDTLSIVKGTGLTGKYTIGGTSPDFTTPDAAIAAMVDAGICGSVEFTIRNGTYNGALTLPEIVGASATNTITFDGQDSSRTTISYNAGARFATLDLRGAKWVTFKNIRFATTASSDGWCVHLNSGASDINFENCWFNMSTSASSDVIGVVASSSAVSENGTGDNVDNLVLENCLFRGGEKGTHLEGNTSSFSSGLEISGCVFNRISGAAIFITNRNSIDAHNNYLSNFRSSASNAFIMYDVGDFDIQNNYISGRNYAFYMEDGNITSNTTSKIINNMITTNGYAMRLNGVRNVNVYHNTLVGSPSFRIEDNTSASILNNIFYSPSDYAFRGSSENGFDDLDWNIYYSGASNKYAMGTNNFTSLANWKSTYGLLNENSKQNQPPIQSTTDPYLSTTSQAARAPIIGGITTDIDGDSRCQYAASIGADESTFSDPAPKARFTLPSSAFFQEKVLIEDQSTGAAVLDLEWSVNGTVVNTGDAIIYHNFLKYGSNKVTLKATSCGGFDTLSKFIRIDTIKQKPDVNFSVDKKVVSVGESVSLTNLTVNGARSYIWSVSPDMASNNQRSYQFVGGSDSSTINCEMFFVEPGEYTICLYAINSLGDDQRCKVRLVIVKDEAEICGNSDESNVGYGTLRDPGGTGNYRGNQRYNCSYLIAPCAKTINLKFNEFDVIDNRDYLRIYEGTDNTGKALHTYHSSYNSGLTGDMSSSNFDPTLTAASNAVYIEFTTSSFFGAPGFELEWTSNSITVPAPTVDFNLPDTVCAGTELFFDNQSSGFGNKYTWSIISPSTNPVVYEDSTTSHFFFFSGKYDVELVANNCGGSDTMKKKIVVVDAKQKPTAKLKVNFPKPDIGQAVTFEDISTVSGYVCSEYRQWSFSPATYTYATGYSQQDQRTKVIFQRAGCYDATLIVGNAVGYDTLRMKCVVEVLNRCVPKVGTLEGDIGIARVQLEDIDNYSPSGVSAYSDYRETDGTELQLGATYDLIVTRDPAPQSNMRRAAWIDYNQDGDFNDVGEEIGRSSVGHKGLSETFTFRVPKTASSGITTLRIGVTKNNGSNTPCGTNPVGEFEDYRIDINADTEAPMIVLFGAKDTTIQQCVGWIDPMGYAVDNGDKGVLSITSSGKVDSSIVGQYTITYSSTDSSGNTGTIDRIITVSTDSLAPVVTLSGTDTVYIDVFDNYTEAGFSSTDFCGVVKDTILGEVNTSKLGTYTLTYESRDAEGNIGSKIRTIIVEDNLPPAVDSLFKGDTVFVAVFDTYTEPGLEYSDNYDPKDSVKLDIKGYLDTDKIGTYILSYTLTDLSGNQDSVFRWVIVYDDIKPVVSVNGALIDTIDVFDTYVDLGIGFSDNYNDSVDLTYNILGSYDQFFGLGNSADSVGTFTIIYEVIDESGNTTTVTRTIEVIDRVAPSMTLLGLNPMYITRWDPFVEPGWKLNDNYWKQSDITVSISGSVDQNSAGIYILEYTPTDASGNVGATVSRTVVVEESVSSIAENGLSNDFSIYPNPTRSSFHVVGASATQGIMEIRVLDAYGRECHYQTSVDGQTKMMTVSLEGMASGVYSVQVRFAGDDWMVKRLTKLD